MPYAPWEQPTNLAPWEEEEASIPEKIWDTAKGIVQLPANMLTGFGAEAAGSIAGLVEYARTSGDPKALEAVRKAVRNKVAETLRIDISEEGTDLEEKISKGFEWLIKKGGDVGESAIGPGGRVLGEAAGEALPFLAPAGVIGARKVMRAPAKIRQTMGEINKPYIGGKTAEQYFIEQYGKNVPSPIERVATLPATEKFAQWAREGTPPPPVPPIPGTGIERMDPYAERVNPLAIPKDVVTREYPFSKSPRTPKRYHESSFDIINNIDTQLLKVLGGNMENPIYAGWRSMEAAIPIKKAEFDPITLSFGKVVKKMTKPERQEFKNAWLVEDMAKARDIFTKSATRTKPRGIENPLILWEQLRPAMDKRFSEIAPLYKETPVYKENYAPRYVSDLEGLKKQLAIDAKKPELAQANKILAKIEELEANLRSSKLDEAAFQSGLNKILVDGFQKKVATPSSGHVQKRTITLKEGEETFTPERYGKYYADPIEALNQYFNDTATNIVERRFLGRGEPQEAIAARMTEAVKEGILSPTQAVDIGKLMQVRFSPTATKSPGKIHTALRDAGYMGTIANPLSASIQLFDVLPAAAKYGFWNAMKALGKSFAPKAMQKNPMLTPGDVGLKNIAHDIVTESGMRGRHYVLNEFMKYSGFRAMDQFGKKVIMETALNKFASMAKKGAVGDKFLRKRGFGLYYKTKAEWDSFKQALASKNVKDPRVQEAMVMELFDIQPHSITSMPISFTKHPKGRIAYMLKTWAIRQLNAVRAEYLKGNYLPAAKLAAYIYLSNLAAPLLRDGILTLFNPDKEMKEWPEYFVNGLYRSMMMDRVASERAAQGNFGPLIASILDIPPLGMGEAVVTDIKNLITGEDKPSKTLEYLPLTGPIIREANREDR
jgi:hypothetical protein